MRINAFLAAAGLGSRRSVEQLVLDGRVQVNGQVIRNLSIQIDPEHDHVLCDGKKAGVSRFTYLMLHKPGGYACTRSDPNVLRTIYDLLPPHFHHLNYAGRLDADSEGLLLLSNDGQWIQKITHPSHQVVKTYEVEVKGRPLPVVLAKARQGISDRKELLKVDSIRVESSSIRSTRLTVRLHEGRKREIRRIFTALRHPVSRLKRVSIGKLHMNLLAPGRWRLLLPEEVSVF